MTRYRKFLASFVNPRDGMALELHDQNGAVLVEVFHDDETQLVTFTSFTDAPIEFSVIADFVSQALKEFPPDEDRRG